MSTRHGAPWQALRDALRAVACAALAAGLAGCANLPFLSPEKPAISTPAAVPVQPIYELDVQAPDDVRALLANYLDLARFRSAPVTDSVSPAELERLIQAAPAQARGLLETAGYFNAEVTAMRVAAEGSTGLPVVRITARPGVRATVAQVSIGVSGALHDAAQAGDATARQAVDSLPQQWALPAGSAFAQGAWADAKNATLGRLRAQGYAAASWASTAARVDAATNRVDISAEVDSGPLFRLGALQIEGLSRYDDDAVRKLSTFGPGTPYNEKLLLDFQERLQKLGLFEGASVELDPDPKTAAAAPVLVRVKEQPLQQATTGVGYSANTGPRVSLEHAHRNVFGTRWIAKNKFELGPELQHWEGELVSYPLAGLYRNLVSGSATNLRAADQTLLSWNARVGRTQDTSRIDRLYFIEFVHARLTSDALTSNADALSYNYHWVYRDIDSVLLPTRGLTASAQAAAGYSRGTLATQGLATIDDRGPFARLYTRLTWYLPFGSDWYGIARAEAGQVFTKSVIGVPDTLLFRAGGDDSVRGYAYRTLGPTTNGEVTGGRSLATASVEIARPISPKYPAFWWAAFADAGDAASRWTDLRPALGYGVGLRWRSPVGPLRVDVAYGQRTQQVRLHLSVGIVF